MGNERAKRAGFNAGYYVVGPLLLVIALAVLAALVGATIVAFSVVL